LNEEIISPEEWINLARTENSKISRRRFLKYYAEANGKQKIEDFVEDLKGGKINIYLTASNLMEFLRKKDSAPNTLQSARSWIRPFWDACIGEDSYKSSVFERRIPSIKVYILVSKKIPKLDNVRYMVQLSTPQYRALIGVLLSGMRIGEIVSRQWRDIEIRPAGHARVKIAAPDTKGKYKRYAFLTKEAVDWLKQFRLTLVNGNGDDSWVFPGELGKHLDENTAYSGMKRLFRIAGLMDTEDESYTVHSFRTLADSIMSKGGMDRKFIEGIIGHKSKLGATLSYPDWEEAEEQFVERVEPVATLTKLVEIIVDSKLTERLEDTENLLDAVLTALLPQTAKMTQRERVEQAKKLLLGDKSKGLPEKK
jgi:integrase